MQSWHPEGLHSAEGKKPCIKRCMPTSLLRFLCKGCRVLLWQRLHLTSARPAQTWSPAHREGFQSPCTQWQNGASHALTLFTYSRLMLLLLCCLFWVHSGRTCTPALLCTTFCCGWVQLHQSQVSKTSFLLLSISLYQLSQERTAIM